MVVLDMATLKTVASYAVEGQTVNNGNQTLEPGPSPTLSSSGDMAMCPGPHFQGFISWEECHTLKVQNF